MVRVKLWVGEEGIYAAGEGGEAAGLALPDDEDGPAEGAEGGRIFSVAGFVGEAFGVPEGGVGLRLDAAVFAGVQVPEAAVDEDDLFEAGEDHVRLAGEVFAVQAEAVAHAMD